MMRLLLVLISLPVFAQINPQWWINDVPAWPLLNAGARNLCFSHAEVSIDSGSYLSMNLEPLSMTCHDTFLDGTTKTTITEQFTGSQVMASSFSFLYGRIDFRAKFPNSTSAWPAVWMTSSNCQQTYKHSLDTLPGCIVVGTGYNEIDFVETLGNPARTGMTVYNVDVGSPEFCNNTLDLTLWHSYSVAWSLASIILSIDGVASCSVTGPIVPSVPMFPMISMEQVNNTLATPVSMLVDYIRIYDLAGTLVFSDEFTGYSKSQQGATTKR